MESHAGIRIDSVNALANVHLLKNNGSFGVSSNEAKKGLDAIWRKNSQKITIKAWCQTL